MGREIERTERCEQAAQMLREVIDGAPYAAVAARRGISRSGVDRRVKALAVHLTQVVGVEGLHATGAMFVKRLRLHREAVLEALDQFDPEHLAVRRTARVLDAAEVELGAGRVRRRSPRSAHDLALYHLAFATGLRPLEVARLEVADYLQEEGNVRRESRVRPEVAINGRERPLVFNHRRLDDALMVYLDERLRDGHGTSGRSAWRGLDPRAALFLDARGEAYEIASIGAALTNGSSCRALLQVYRCVYRQAGIPGLCMQSARLTLMSRMYERGADEDQVGLALGIADRGAVRERLARPRPPLAKVLQDLA